jgi:hypothetical protein
MGQPFQNQYNAYGAAGAGASEAVGAGLNNWVQYSLYKSDLAAVGRWRRRRNTVPRRQCGFQQERVYVYEATLRAKSEGAIRSIILSYADLKRLAQD